MPHTPESLGSNAPDKKSKFESNSSAAFGSTSSSDKKARLGSNSSVTPDGFGSNSSDKRSRAGNNSTLVEIAWSPQVGLSPGTDSAAFKSSSSSSTAKEKKSRTGAGPRFSPLNALKIAVAGARHTARPSQEGRVAQRGELWDLCASGPEQPCTEQSRQGKRPPDDASSPAAKAESLRPPSRSESLSPKDEEHSMYHLARSFQTRPEASVLKSAATVAVMKLPDTASALPLPSELCKQEDAQGDSQENPQAVLDSERLHDADSSHRPDDKAGAVGNLSADVRASHVRSVATQSQTSPRSGYGSEPAATPAHTEGPLSDSGTGSPAAHELCS